MGQPRQPDAQVEYILRLRPLRSGIPVPVRLKHLLKLALRVCELRAVSVEEIAPSGANTSGNAQDAPKTGPGPGNGLLPPPEQPRLISEVVP
jgi:hypothetical protein